MSQSEIEQPQKERLPIWGILSLALAMLFYVSSALFMIVILFFVIISLDPTHDAMTIWYHGNALVAFLALIFGIIGLCDRTHFWSYSKICALLGILFSLLPAVCSLGIMFSLCFRAFV